MYVEIGRRPEALDQRDRAAVGFVGLETGLLEQVARDQRCTTCNTGVTSTGCAANSRRSGMGSDSTHWRTGTRGMTWSTRCAALRDMRRAPHEGQNPRRLQLNTKSLSWAQSAQRRRRKRCACAAHSRYASNSSLTNCGRFEALQATASRGVLSCAVGAQSIASHALSS